MMNIRMVTRYALLAVWLGLRLYAPATAQTQQAVMHPGDAVLMRHALAPGTGDPAHFVLGDCMTQRNLDAQGRLQAARIGRFFARQGVPVETVWSSQWCRARETADIAFPGRRLDKAVFNSFFGEPAAANAQTDEARTLLDSWTGLGLLVVVTHQVNITAMTGVVPAPGEAVVLRRHGSVWGIAGRLFP